MKEELDKDYFKQKSIDEKMDINLIRVLMRKMEKGSLSEKEVHVMKQLRGTYKKGNGKKNISNAQLNRAVSRNKQAILKKSNGSVHFKENRKIRIDYFYGAVSVVAVLVLLFSLYISTDSSDNKNGVEIVTNSLINNRFTTDDNIKRITLADGSTVYLNRETSLSLREGRFNADIREVWLDEGEAFFSITKDPNRPFIVHSPNGVTTRVLGTSFNIKSYSELPDQVITVNTGKVQVLNERKEEMIIEPNYKVSISSSDGIFTPGKTNAQSVSDWRSGKIVLENASLKEISFYLRQYYSVELIYDDERFSDEQIYTFFTPEMPLEEVITVISKLFNATSHTDGTKVYLEKIQ
ncbi:MAG: FecR domain-containing protein [Proteiniphilum sp.]|nr:FecR domain-containing protein [Proteiniphilum sp.]